MHRSLRIGTAAIALLLLVTGCSRPGQQGERWTYRGNDTLDIEKSLQDMTKTWRDKLDGQDPKPRVPDDAGCYLQVSEPHDGVRDIGRYVLCGPYRSVGSPATQWAAAPIKLTFDGGTDRGRLSLTSDATFSPSKPLDKSTVVKADGTSVDIKQNVDEPDAPEAKTGDVIKNAWGDVQGTNSEPVIVPGYTFTFRTDSAARVGTGKDRRQAPAGGSFLIVQVTRQVASDSYGSSSSNSQVTAPSTVSVKQGGKDYPIPAENGTYAVAIGSDGKDATLAVTCDGLTQQVGRDGKRIGQQAAAYYLKVNSAKLDVPEVKAGDGKTEGNYIVTSASSSKVSVSAYHPKYKWAGEGKMWVTVEGYLSASTFHYNYDCSGYCSYAYYDPTWVQKSITLGGVAAKEATIGASGTWSGTPMTLVFEVPAKVADTAFAGTFALRGTRGASSTKAPATITQDVALKGTLVLR